MTLPKSLWTDLLIFAAIFFFFGLGLDWLRGRELDYANRALTTGITIPVYIIMKIWFYRSQKKGS